MNLRRGLPQFIVVSITNLIFLGWGLILGYPTILIPGLQTKNNVNLQREFVLSEDEISWISSIILLFVPVGTLFSALLMDRIGKKRVMQLLNLPMMLAWALLYFASNLIQIYIGLSLMGISGGLLEAPLLIYIAETVEPKYRGMLTASTIATFFGAVCVQYVIGGIFHWRIVAAISGFITFFTFSAMFLVPETPYWLIASNRYEAAQRSLQWLRGWVTFDTVEEEFNYILTNVEKDKIETRKCQQKNFRMKLRPYTKRTFIAPFLLVLVSFVLSLFSGTSVLGTYAVEVFGAYKVPLNGYYATMYLGLAQFIGCMIGMMLVRVMGKRRLVFISFFGCAVCLFIVANQSEYGSIRHFNTSLVDVTLSTKDDDQNKDWIPFILLLVGTTFSHAGARNFPFFLLGEVFTMDVRSTAANISSAINFFFSFLVNKLFLSMVAVSTLNGTLCFFSVVGFVAVFVLYFILPETEGRSIEEVQSLFDNDNVNNSDQYIRKFVQTKTNNEETRLKYGGNSKGRTCHSNI